MTTAVSTRAQEFRDQLARRVIVADGAMGTMLYSRGVFINRCFDELNLAQPDLVRQIHREYVKAGADMLETNTFGANRTRLAAFGMAEKLAAINVPVSASPAKQPVRAKLSSPALSARWEYGSNRLDPLRSPKLARSSANRPRRSSKAAQTC